MGVDEVPRESCFEAGSRPWTAKRSQALRTTFLMSNPRGTAHERGTSGTAPRKSPGRFLQRALHPIRGFMSAVLGINAVFHDPAAALVVDGVVVAAAEEE